MIKSLLGTVETNDMSAHTANRISRENSLKISTSKTKVMAFKGIDPLWANTVIANITVEQVHTFEYLCYNVSHANDSDALS